MRPIMYAGVDTGQDTGEDQGILGVMPALSLERVRALRLISQLLAPSAALNFKSERNAVDVAKHMLASQAQQRGSALVALDTRSENADAATALRKSLLIRSWTQRGTHQILAAEDVRWMTLLCSPRILAASAKRRSSLSLDSAAVQRARDALTTAAEKSPYPEPRPTKFSDP